MSEVLHEQAVAYVLGELEGEELADFERRLAADPTLREEVDRLEPTVTELRELPPEAWEAADPPPLELRAMEPRPARDTSKRPSGRRWPAWPRLVLVGAACAALFAGGVLLGTGLDDDPAVAPARASIELRPLAGSEASGSVELVADDPREAVVVVDGLPESAPGTYYELWLLRDDQLVALGSFTVGPEGHADTAISIPVDPGSYDAFDISVEREDGDPSHSGDSVLRGPTAPS